MGKRAQNRRSKRDEIEQEKKLVRLEREKELTPWLNFWRRIDFWIYVVAFIAIILFPILRRDSLGLNDRAIIHTSMGDITVQLYKDEAPKTVENFSLLSERGYYNNLIWHRVIKGFMIQGGDPTGNGTGGESAWGDSFEDEINPRSLGMAETDIRKLEEKGSVFNYNLTSHLMEVGSIAMANSGPNTNGSQFFIVTEKDQPHLNGQHTVFGKVLEGLDIAKKISEVPVDENDKPENPVFIKSIEIR